MTCKIIAPESKLLKNGVRDRPSRKWESAKSKSVNSPNIWDFPGGINPPNPVSLPRFPYGEEITVEKLRRVGRAEVYLRGLGWPNLRVRSQGDTARIELPPESIQDFVLKSNLAQIVAKLQELGFLFVTLDLEGYQSGKLNRVLERQAVTV